MTTLTHAFIDVLTKDAVKTKITAILAGIVAVPTIFLQATEGYDGHFDHVLYSADGKAEDAQVLKWFRCKTTGDLITHGTQLK